MLKLITLFTINSLVYSTCSQYTDSHELTVFKTGPAEQAKMLFIDRTGHDQLALEIADNTACDNIGPAERTVVTQGIDGVVFRQIK